MPEVSYNYISESLETLFTEEFNILNRIKGFCERNNKEVSINYFVGVKTFKLEILVV